MGPRKSSNDSKEKGASFPEGKKCQLSAKFDSKFTFKICSTNSWQSSLRLISKKFATSLNPEEKNRRVHINCDQCALSAN
jgi:hypothetical protein